MVKKYEKYKWKDLQVFRNHVKKSLSEKNIETWDDKYRKLSSMVSWMQNYYNPIGDSYSRKLNQLPYGSKCYEFWSNFVKDLNIHWSIFHKEEGIKLRKEVVNKYFNQLAHN